MQSPERRQTLYVTYPHEVVIRGEQFGRYSSLTHVSVHLVLDYGVLISYDSQGPHNIEAIIILP